MIPFAVAGWGRARPPRRVTNAELEATLDTTDEWIRERTGIEARHVGGSTTELAVAAAHDAVQRAGVPGGTIDTVVVATSTGELAFPAVAATVAGEIGSSGATFDLNAACAGFSTALVTAAGWLAVGARRVLVVGADAMSTVTDPTDRSTAVIFADGAGALVLDAGGPGGLLGWDAGTDPSSRSILRCPTGGPVQMEGQAVFKVAVRAAEASVAAALDRAGIGADQVDLFVPHQANQRITDAIARRLGWGPERVVATLSDTGNSSAGTIGWSLAVAADDGRLTPGAVVVACGFGAGMTWSTAVLRWVPA